MKVLLVNTYCGISSTGRICTDLANTLMQQGHEVRVAYGSGKPLHIDPAYTIKIGTKKDWFFHTTLTKLTDSQCLHSKHATKKFIEEVKKFQPDLIHLHNIHGNYLHMEELVAFLNEINKPVVWTFHDCWPFTGHCAYFTIAKCDKWKTGCYTCEQERQYPRCYGMDRSKRNYALKKDLFTSMKDLTIVTPSRWLKGLVEESFLQNKEVKVIPNGIDLSNFKKASNEDILKTRTKYHLENKKVVLGVASGWNPNKGLEDFIQLSKLLDDSYKVVLVGVKDAMVEEIEKHGIVAITKTDSVDELRDLYSVATVFVNPTHQDNYPTVNLEAIACGCPVLAYDVGGNKESAFLTTNECVIEHDVKALATRIRNGDYKLKEIDLDSISKERMVSLYMNLYVEKVSETK